MTFNPHYSLIDLKFSKSYNQQIQPETLSITPPESHDCRDQLILQLLKNDHRRPAPLATTQLCSRWYIQHSVPAHKTYIVVGVVRGGWAQQPYSLTLYRIQLQSQSSLTNFHTISAMNLGFTLCQCCWSQPLCLLAFKPVNERSPTWLRCCLPQT